MKVLKGTLTHCQRLESIKILNRSNEREILEIIVEYLPKSFRELELYHVESDSRLTTEELESFFMKWGNRVPRKSLLLLLRI